MEDSDIFISNKEPEDETPEVAPEALLKPKRQSSPAQLAAYEKMRQKRDEKLASKKKPAPAPEPEPEKPILNKKRDPDPADEPIPKELKKKRAPRKKSEPIEEEEEMTLKPQKGFLGAERRALPIAPNNRVVGGPPKVEPIFRVALPKPKRGGYTLLSEIS